MAGGPLIKSTSRAEWRRALSRRWTWIVQGEVGLMPLEASRVGLADRLHGGGEDGLRGFRERGIGPVDPRDRNLHIGGSTSLVLRNEVRYRFNDSVQLPLFLDIGTLEGQPFAIGAPRASVGFGARFVMPGSNQKGYVYLAHNFLREKTDDSLTLRFGFNVDF